MLYQHGKDEDLMSIPIGHWEDWQFDGVNWSAIPVFSKADHPKVSLVRTLYNEGHLKAASIGAAIRWETTGKMMRDTEGNVRPEPKLTNEGYRVSENALLYEISIVAMPSNPDAVSLTAHVYSDEEILILNSKFMAEEKTTEAEKPVKKVKEVEEKEKEPQHIILKIKEAILSIFEAETPKMVPEHKEPDGDEPLVQKDLPQDNEPQGATKATKLEAEEETEAAKKAKEEELEAESKKSKDEEFCKKLDACTNEAELAACTNEYGGGELPSVIKDAISRKKESFNSINLKTAINMETPELKKTEELAAEIKLAAVPQVIKVGKNSQGVTFTELACEKDTKTLDGILKNGGKVKDQIDLQQYSVIADAIINDTRLKAIVDKFTLSGDGMAKNSIFDLRNQIEAGNLEGINFKTGKRQMMQFTSSDDALTTPATAAIEFMSLFLFNLFPSQAWKSKIPIFGASEAGKNLGLIWTNIAANPAVYKGNKPTTPADYATEDTAVSVKLVNYWLQPMLWTPLTMAYKRYDQMGAQWAQAMMVFNTYIDDYLLYTLNGLVPAASKLYTSGTSFNIANATDVNAFVQNTAFAGDLNKPLLNDIVKIEQLFNKQNFDSKKFVVAMDPTMDSYITQDPETKSLLTRWVGASGEEVLGFKRGEFAVRSKTGLVDPAAAYIAVDPTGVIPATAISTALAFIPDQIGLAIGNLDVFMIQDPTNYGYRMSADVRMGATALRADAKGLASLTYGTPSN
jgi:hypothetical protein